MRFAPSGAMMESGRKRSIASALIDEKVWNYRRWSIDSIGMRTLCPLQTVVCVWLDSCASCVDP